MRHNCVTIWELDSNLTMENHINKCVKNANKTKFMVSKLRRCLTNRFFLFCFLKYFYCIFSDKIYTKNKQICLSAMRCLCFS